MHATLSSGETWTMPRKRSASTQRLRQIYRRWISATPENRAGRSDYLKRTIITKTVITKGTSFQRWGGSERISGEGKCGGQSGGSLKHMSEQVRWPVLAISWSQTETAMPTSECAMVCRGARTMSRPGDCRKPISEVSRPSLGADIVGNFPKL